jgi:MarR family transcriptional regulator, organic hydroperoxide resistance regulator
VLFEFVRHWSRRTAGEAAEQGRLVVVVEAVHSLAARTSPTINAVAHEIGIDQSGASRLVKDAVAAGHLELAPSVTDARRREVAVTAAGRRMLRDAHRWQESVFSQLTEHWSAGQRDDFRRAMLDLVERSHGLGE